MYQVGSLKIICRKALKLHHKVMSHSTCLLSCVNRNALWYIQRCCHVVSSTSYFLSNVSKKSKLMLRLCSKSLYLALFRKYCFPVAYLTMIMLFLVPVNAAASVASDIKSKMAHTTVSDTRTIEHLIGRSDDESHDH